ncbi:MAG: hypothetical protein ACPGWR_25590 [Ardenticatenaceae bacterium]
MTIKKRWHAIDNQFEQAIQQDDLPAITHLIEKAKLLRQEDVRLADYFHCLLRVPCECDDLVALEKLIEAGADINKVNVFGDEFTEPPLQIAIQEVNLALLEYLIFPRKGMKRADLEVPFIWEGQHLPQRPLMFAVECHYHAKRKALHAPP